MNRIFQIGLIVLSLVTVSLQLQTNNCYSLDTSRPQVHELGQRTAYKNVITAWFSYAVTGCKPALASFLVAAALDAKIVVNLD